MSLLDQVRSIAYQAGLKIKEYYASQTHKVDLKEDDSPITCADRASHELICEELPKLEGHYPVLSEESKASKVSKRKLWDTYWLVDPLDGTKEFIKRTGDFTVNIALIRDGIPVLGVVYAPVIETNYFAAKGLGAFCEDNNRNQKKIKTRKSSEDRLICLMSRSHKGGEADLILERCPKAKIIQMGSSLKLCLIAEGKADLYFRMKPTMEWDTAAAQCIVEEAGGKIMNLDGEQLKYNKEDLHNPFFVVVGDPNLNWRQFL